jgi:hypothetical protein
MSLHRFACLTATIALVGLAPAIAAEPLKGPQIESTLSGATTSGVNAFGNPYTVHILADGSTEGVAGVNDEYQDSGTWWIEGDTYCRRWNTWLEGQTACFSVMIEGGTVSWLDVATGQTVVESFTPGQ